MAAEKRGKVCWTQKTSLPSAVSFLSFFDEPHDFFDARAIDLVFFVRQRRQSVFTFFGSLAYSRRHTHQKRFILLLSSTIRILV